MHICWAAPPRVISGTQLGVTMLLPRRGSSSDHSSQSNWMCLVSTQRGPPRVREPTECCSMHLGCVNGQLSGQQSGPCALTRRGRPLLEWAGADSSQSKWQGKPCTAGSPAWTRREPEEFCIALVRCPQTSSSQSVKTTGHASCTHQAALPGSRVEAAGLHRAHTCCLSLTQAWLWAARTVGRYHRHTTLPPGTAHAHPTPTSLPKPPGLHRHPFPQDQFLKTGREKLYHLTHRNKRKSQRKTNEIEKICLIKNLKELL